MEKLFLLLTIVVLSFSSCSSNKTCKYERGYNETVLSLKNFLKENERTVESINAPFITDLTELSCSDFQSKYELSDEEMKEKLKQVISLTGNSLWDAGEYMPRTYKNGK